MKVYKAIRLTLSEATILGSNGGEIAHITWPKVGIWKTKNAPLSDALGDGWQSNPSIEIGSKKLVALRTLLTDKFLVNDFEISLKDESDQALIFANLKGSRKKIVMRFENSEYLLTRESFFSFRFSLQKDGTRICQMKDMTPFFTVSSRREFVIEAEKDVEPILLSFSFFLAHNIFF